MKIRFTTNWLIALKKIKNLYTHLAKEIRAFWPPLSITPRSPTNVWSPLGMLSMS